MDDDKKSLDGMGGTSMPQEQGDATKINVQTEDMQMGTPLAKAPEHDPLATATPDQKQAEKPENKEKKHRSKKPLYLILVLLLVLGAAAGTYLFRQGEIDDLNSQVASLTSQNAELKTENANLKKDQEGSDTPTTGDETPSEEPVDLPALIETSVSSGKYADLQPHMATSVMVIIGASEGLGERTPAQAVADMKYLDAGTDPWDFAVDADSLNQYRVGPYASYFPTSAVVGVSANKYATTFQFDSTGKIAAIFMIANTDLLAD